MLRSLSPPCLVHLLISALLSFSLCSAITAAWAKEPVLDSNLNQTLPKPSRTFQLNAQQTHNLPPAMYGTWSIQATVLKSDAPPWFYTPSTSEIWTLTQESQDVILENVVTNAVTSVTVDKVSGNTATFHHSASNAAKGIAVLEVPTITVEGDHLHGINRQTITVTRGKKTIIKYQLEIEVSGTRLAGAPFVFRGTSPATAPQFEVAPLQVED